MPHAPRHSLLLLTLAAAAAGAIPHKRWACTAGRCAPTKGAGGTGLDQCLMTCQGSLWPQPSGATTIGHGYIALSTAPAFDYTSVAGDEARALLKTMAGNFVAHTFGEDARAASAVAADTIKFVVASTTAQLSLEVDESYTLAVDGAAATITAATVYGARHGLETLSQLVAYDPAAAAGARYSRPSAVSIEDRPFYSYRGVMIDVARTFFPMDLLKTAIRGLAMTKMNRLHLHLTDTASFPVLFEAHPELAEAGATSPEEAYTIADIKELTQYAREHGVLLVPEVDQPSHAAAGWPADGENPMVVCTTGAWGSEASEPPSGQFNPVNPAVHDVLGDIYGELATAFDSGVFHLGGDELKVAGCWNSTEHAPAVVEYLDAHGYDRGDMKMWFDLWGNFTATSLDRLRKAYTARNKPLDKVMNWAGQDSGVNLLVALGKEGRAKLFPKDLFMFQLWDPKHGSFADTLMAEGYDVVLSHYDQLYLDCGVDGWVNAGKYWCGFVSWKEIYGILSPADDNPKLKGAEAPLWSEVIGPSTMLSKLFPRAAALGERLWTNPTSDWHAADPRMQAHNDRMTRHGIAAEQTQPAWCLQHGKYSCTT